MQSTTVVTDGRSWLWPPLLGFARGMAVVALLSVSMVMFKRLGMSNSWASCGTALLAVPYVCRQLLRPFVTAMPHRGWWMVAMQLLFALSLLGVALTVTPGTEGGASWWWLGVGAFAAAFHDILASDYCNALRGNRKPGRTLVLATLPLLAVVLGLGITLVIAGDMEVLTRDVAYSWSLAFEVLAGMAFVVALVTALAKPRHVGGEVMPLKKAWRVQMKELERWWCASHQWTFAAFIVLFTLHECFILKGVLLFLVDPGSIGGLSMGPQEVAFAHSTVAGMAMVAGCVAGFTMMRRDGLRRWVWPMVLAITVPDILLLYLAYAMPSELSLVTACLAVESFGCGFGLAGFVCYLRYYGPRRGLPAYGDSCLALVALSACLSGVVTGFLQDYFGYRRFFLFVVLMAIVAAASLALLGKIRSGHKKSS